jgi:hypothetical protein
MSVNLNTLFWKTILKYLAVFALGCFVAFWFRGCSGTTPTRQTAKVTIPELKAKFEAKKPVHEAIVINANNKANVQKGKTVFVENPIDEKLITENEKLKKDFAKADSATKDMIFEKVATLNKFSTKFEDENIIINIDGIVQGEVKEITPSYIRKKIETEVPVKVKETVLRVLVGGGFGLNQELNQIAYKVDLNFQNKKGDIISGERLQIGNQKYWMAGFKKSIINIKR